MKSSGWMVNLTMRRVEPVTAGESRLNRADYGLYKGPRRTYMLHDCQVFDTELQAMQHLADRMAKRYIALVGQTYKYRTELNAVLGALKMME